jgi:hypothetical protein
LHVEQLCGTSFSAQQLPPKGRKLKFRLLAQLLTQFGGDQKSATQRIALGLHARRGVEHITMVDQLSVLRSYQHGSDRTAMCPRLERRHHAVGALIVLVPLGKGALHVKKAVQAYHNVYK